MPPVSLAATHHRPDDFRKRLAHRRLPLAQLGFKLRQRRRRGDATPEAFIGPRRTVNDGHSLRRTTGPTISVNASRTAA